mmetsp:Transcript_131941/g.329086  ORF Transcript_131941/g.329086 Transcript_131941/m.329086 type:complete len:345 (-) Transcript_131941:1077-2111(-)
MRWLISLATRWISAPMFTSTTLDLASASAIRTVISRSSSPLSSAVRSRILEVSSIRSSASISPMSRAKPEDPIALLASVAEYSFGVFDSAPLAGVMEGVEARKVEEPPNAPDLSNIWPLPKAVALSAILFSALSIVSAAALATSSATRSTSANARQRSRRSLSRSFPRRSVSALLAATSALSAAKSSSSAKLFWAVACAAAPAPAINAEPSNLASLLPMAARSVAIISVRDWSPDRVGTTVDGNTLSCLSAESIRALNFATSGSGPCECVDSVTAVAAAEAAALIRRSAASSRDVTAATSDARRPCSSLTRSWTVSYCDNCSCRSATAASKRPLSIVVSESWSC